MCVGLPKGYIDSQLPKNLKYAIVLIMWNLTREVVTLLNVSSC